MSVQLVVASGSRAGQTIPVTVPKFLIGRADDCHLKPRSELISRYHCAVVTDGERVVIRDLGSKNGVFLNDKRASIEAEMKHGDKITVGPLEFFVHISVETKAEKKSKVESVSDAVARTVEIQGGAPVDQFDEKELSNWLIAPDESGENLETQTVDASELLASITQTIKNEPKEDPGTKGTGKVPAEGSSKDAASKLIKSFFGMK
ncbi:MAG: FHA domain-containing protein [Planctomycetaceae bacterium]|nr:FHA domain-containing protein [Planctomycetaceae bacterium]